jgi:hypothetical protein
VQADEQTCMTKLVAAFRNFSKAPKKFVNIFTLLAFICSRNKSVVGLNQHQECRVTKYGLVKVINSTGILLHK